MLTADVSLAEVSRAALRLSDKERLELAMQLFESAPDYEYEVDNDETLLRRPDVQEGIRGMIDIIEGREQGLSEEEYETEIQRLETEVLREREQRQNIYPEELCMAAPLAQTYKAAS